MSGARSGPAALGGGQQQSQSSHSDTVHYPASSPASSATASARSGVVPASASSALTRLQIFSTWFPQSYVTSFCGASAGVTSGIVTCPLDVIKTKLQAQGGFQLRRNGKLIHGETLYRGMVGTGKMIWRDEGLRGLYKGLGPMLLGYLPTWAIYLSVYERSKEFYGEKIGM